jgi:glycosyltransferase involved in cell wall biosynthesis
MRVATVVTRSELARARVLAGSFLDHHPDGSVTTLLLDGTVVDAARADVPGEVLVPGDLGFDLGAWRVAAVLLPADELARATVPLLLASLLMESPTPVVHLEVTCRVERPLTAIATAAAEHSVALVPHVLAPLPDDGATPDAQWLDREGAFSTGCIAVSGGAEPFLRWWADGLDARELLRHADDGRQARRLDAAPALFRHVVLRDPGYDVGFWNAHERDLDAVVVANFRGYDPDAPWRYSREAGDRPRCLLGESPRLAQRCDDYREELLGAGHEAARRTPFGLGRTSDGVALTALVRAAYGRGLAESAAQGDEPPPGPFDADGGRAFRSWLEAPAYGPVNARLDRLALEHWSRSPELAARFPDVTGFDAGNYLDWFRSDEGAQEQVRAGGLTVARPSPALVPAAREIGGWNVVGYFSAELGIGEAGRRLAASLEAAGIPTEPVGVSTGFHRTGHPLRRPIASSLRYRDSIYSINAAELARVIALAGETRERHGTRIAQWFWEVDRFPERWHHTFGLLDEVWVQSRFTYDVLAAISPIPVRLVPLAVRPPARPTPFRREHLGLPEGFVFLFCYDYFSVMARKNPLDLLSAYTRAFGPDDGASLVLKSINGHRRPLELDRLRQAVGDRSDVVVLDRFMDPARVQGLIELSDCFVSLHRSEGFGLNIAAAMAAGRPVVATGYSGNMDFMDERSAFLVPYELVPVGADNDPYPADAMWAQPDLDAAAAAMRLVFDDPGEATERADRGRELVLERQAPARSASVVAEALLGFVPDAVTGLDSRRSA